MQNNKKHANRNKEAAAEIHANEKNAKKDLQMHQAKCRVTIY